MTRQILRLPRVKEVTGLSRSSIYQLVAKGQFPRPIQITDARAVGWIESEIFAYLDQKAAKRSAVK